MGLGAAQCLRQWGHGQQKRFGTCRVMPPRQPGWCRRLRGLIDRVWIGHIDVGEGRRGIAAVVEPIVWGAMSEPAEIVATILTRPGCASHQRSSSSKRGGCYLPSRAARACDAGYFIRHLIYGAVYALHKRGRGMTAIQLDAHAGKLPGKAAAKKAPVLGLFPADTGVSFAIPDRQPS
jgi:hypothetical protein